MQELCLTIANVFLRFDFDRAEGEEGRLGGGGIGAEGKEWGRQRTEEFQVKSYFTSHMNGPMVRFKKRNDNR
jgi:hypothetical protein